ncbi:MAG TPA: DNA internalization-related competence protein ComEC/Rec2 [Burkholderiales bacterium]|nr:DNA internalization-related competence protein ComEC/Rec2 [Burkholderiales bacterium]
MTGAALAFAAGVLLLQQQAALPHALWLLLLPACALLAAWRRFLLVPAAFAVGLLWAAGFAHLRLADRLATELEGRDLEVAGVVASLPAAMERGLRFEFDLESAPAGLPRRVLLSWYRSAFAEEAPAPLARAVHPGERWLFTVRLRQPHGHLNPHGFDYEAWLTERGIGATGYVRNRGVQRLLGRRDSLADRIESAREAVRDRFQRVLGETPSAGILAALAVGEQRAIANEEWRLFSRTGVTHLMSISGLHVTLVSGLCAWLVSALWRRVPRLALALPARKAGALAAIAAALAYTLLAGFAVPAQRTFYMVTVVALALWSGRIASPARTLALALAVVTALDPWAVLQAGFWLSFGAVALIFYVSAGWTGREARALQWLRVQWAITAGLAPAALFLFAQVSVVGPLANALAIPLVSAVITPLALVAAVLPADALLHLAEWLTQWLLEYLDWCAQLPAAAWQQHAPPLWATLLALAGVAWLLLPRGFPWRTLGIALMAPAFALPAAAPAPGEAWITTLDVGQGLAVVVRTANRALLYDTGPAYGADADSGERIVAPYLRATGVAQLDALVLTHNDTDHTGGAWSVLAAMQVDRVLHSLPSSHTALALAAETQRCARGMAWQWDGVRFEMLHPAPASGARRRNDESCVLRVTTAGGAMLLTGDIERGAEMELARSGLAHADVLLVPHHGSRTSSSVEFLAAVRPRHAITPVGYRSRFGHPHPEVLARYAAAGLVPLRTDRDGAVTVRLSPGAPALEIERGRRARYWHVPPRPA